MASKRLQKIYERDRGICHLCGNKVSIENASLDHIIPKSLGGAGGLANLALSHKYCNHFRGTVTVLDFKLGNVRHYDKYLRKSGIKNYAVNARIEVKPDQVYATRWRCTWCGSNNFEIFFSGYRICGNCESKFISKKAKWVKWPDE